jgi:hypothetical protein
VGTDFQSVFILPKSPTFAQKKKWAKTHRITHPKIRASWKLYDPDPVEASEGGRGVVSYFEALCVTCASEITQSTGN